MARYKITPPLIENDEYRATVEYIGINSETGIGGTYKSGTSKLDAGLDYRQNIPETEANSILTAAEKSGRKVERIAD